MSMFVKTLAYMLGCSAAAGVAGVGYLYVREPARAAAPAIRVPMTAERIARGRYLFNLAACDDCHSRRDFTRFAGPVMASGRAVGVVLPAELGLPGRISAPNITPDRETGIGAWTDGEKMRAIREGIGRDGRALFPMMGYERYRHMSDDDVQALVAYLNTLAPLRNPVPRSRVSFPTSLLIKSVPQPAGSVPPPDRTNKLEYGQYLVTLAGCAGCHTTEDGQPFAGGQVFRLPGGTTVSSNITPDHATGIGSWSETYFVERFAQYKEYVREGAPKCPSESFTVMPWLNFAQIAPEDLKAIYAYLRRQPAVHNAVTTHPAEPTSKQ